MLGNCTVPTLKPVKPAAAGWGIFAGLGAGLPTGKVCGTGALKGNRAGITLGSVAGDVLGAGAVGVGILGTGV